MQQDVSRRARAGKRVSAQWSRGPRIALLAAIALAAVAPTNESSSQSTGAQNTGAQSSRQPPGLEFAFEVLAQVADPTVVGELPTGQTRRIIDILGGTFEGPGLKGTLLPGGADWQLIRRGDGFTDIDARYTLQTDNGDLIYVTNIGIRHAAPEVMRRLNAGETVDQSEIYFRAIPKFETAAPELEWLMRSIFVSTGERYPNGVIIRFWRVL